jgi:hypothetical protein
MALCQSVLEAGIDRNDLDAAFDHFGTATTSDDWLRH